MNQCASSFSLVKNNFASSSSLREESCQHFSNWLKKDPRRQLCPYQTKQIHLKYRENVNTMRICQVLKAVLTLFQIPFLLVKLLNVPFSHYKKGIMVFPPREIVAHFKGKICFENLMKSYVFSIVDFIVLHSIRAESSTYENLLHVILAKNDSH